MIKTTFSTKDIINDSFRKRVGMYTGEMTLKSIFLYINTYRNALLNYNIKDISTPNFSYFNDFVKDKFCFHESTAGWKNMIIAISLGLDSKKTNWTWDVLQEKESKMTKEEHLQSIRLFFTLFDEFYK